jgi:Bifunctional DNA primase/polymerase, N-terminal/AAA domain/Primase C terminal 2 (PriCT-2)
VHTPRDTGRLVVNNQVIACPLPRCMLSAIHYAERGWQVFPAPQGTKKSHKSAKFSDGRNWGATTDADEIRRDFAQWPEANVGVPTGKISGIWVLEADTPEGHDVDGITSLRALEAQHGKLPDTLTAVSPTGSLHYYIKHPGGDIKIKNSASEIAPGVDVRGDGGMVIAPPSIKPGVGSYRYINWVPIAETPEWLVDLAKKQKHEPSDEQEPDDLDADSELVAEALAVIKPDTRSARVNVGMALRHAEMSSNLKGLFPLWDKWLSQCDDYEHHICKNARRAWDGFEREDGEVVTLATVFRYANKANPNWRDDYDAAVLARIDAAAHNPDVHAAIMAELGVGDSVGIEQGIDHDEQAKDEPRQEDQKQSKANEKIASFILGRTGGGSSTVALATFKHGEASADPGPQVIRNRLPQKGKGYLSGQWGSFKTFMFLDMASAIMAGGFWTGEPVYRQGGVLLFATEGASGIGLRLAAMVEHRLPSVIDSQRDLPDTLKPKPIDKNRLPFEWTDSCPKLLGDVDPLPAMIATAKQAHDRFMREFGLPLVAIGIDTMSTAAGMTEESSNAEAARVLDILGQLSNATNSVVIAVDHFGKNLEAGTRGASAKEANADFVLSTLGDRSLSGEVTNTRLAIRKEKEGPQGMEFSFAGRVVDMGRDIHGYPITARVIDWNVVHEKPRSVSELMLERALAMALGRHGESIRVVVDGFEKQVQGANKEWVRTAYKELFVDEKPQAETRTVNAAFRRAMDKAESKAGRVSTQGDFIFFKELPM